MAQMVPETIPAKASQGKKLLFNILRDRLPDDFRVWYEPSVKGLYPDFIVLGPTFGLLVLEVKGWYAHQILRVNQNFFEIRQRQGEKEWVESQKSPLRQGHDYFAAVSEKLRGYPILTTPDGDYKGKLAFPIGVGAIMSNLTEAQSRDEGIYICLEKPQVAYRDELLMWQELDAPALIQRLQDMFTVQFPFFPLSDDQISTIKGVIHPEVAIRHIPATQLSLPIEVQDTYQAEGSVIVSLDIEQEKLARTMTDGHRLFSGVAGSGKTLILLSRAKALANRLLEHRVLVLCFNISLASHLRSLLHSDPQNPQYQERIEVRHFHDWARTLLGRLPNPQEFNGDDEYNQFLGDYVLAALQQRSPEQKWNSVLVDEAHTFNPNWFLCCVAALKDPQEGDLLVVSDGSQSLYRRRKFSWKSVGINIRGGRSRKLSQNYRNTQEILTAAWQVVQRAADNTAGDEDPAFPIVEPSAALRHGPRPVLHRSTSKERSLEALVAQVQELAQAGYAPGEIAILYRWKSRYDDALFQGMLKRLQDLGLRTYWVTESSTTKRDYSVTRPGIRIITTLSSLGLEFKAVLVLWVEQFMDCCGPDAEEAALARRQLYVAMTRAQDELHLFSSGRAPLLQDLEQSQAFEVIWERRLTTAMLAWQ